MVLFTGVFWSGFEVFIFTGICNAVNTRIIYRKIAEIILFFYRKIKYPPTFMLVLLGRLFTVYPCSTVSSQGTQHDIFQSKPFCIMDNLSRFVQMNYA